MDLEDIYAEGVDAVEEILSKALYYDVRKSLNPLHLPDFEKLTRSIAKSLKGHALPVEDKALKQAMNVLDAKWTDMTGPARGKLLDEAFKYVGKPVANAVIPKVVQTLTFAGKDIIASTKKNATLTYDLKVGPDLTLSDDRILTACIVSQGHYVTDAYGKRADLAALQAKGLVAAGLAEGLGSAEISDNLRAQLASQVQGRGPGYWDIVAGVFANRARTVTQLAAFHTAGIAFYQWESVLDEATSVQCRFMHGRTFHVKSAMARFDKVEAESASDPEAIEKLQPFLSAGRNLITGDPSLCYTDAEGSRRYAARVTENAVGQKDKVGAFDKAHSDEDLAYAGITCPPIHGRCRSTIIPIEATGEGGGPLPAAPGEPAPPPPKLTSGQAKAKALHRLEIAQSLSDSPGYIMPSDVFVQAPSETPLDHPFFAATADGVGPGWGDAWTVNAIKKKPKIDELIPTTPGIDADTVKGYIQKPLSLDKAPAPKVVKLDGKLYVMTGHEQILAQKFMGQKLAYCDFVDLDKPLKPVPLVHPVEPPPAESALGHVIKPVEPAHPPAPPPFAPALSPPVPMLDAKVVLHEKTGGPGGSNDGGFYTGSDGVKRYVKFYVDSSQSYGENLANAIYADLGHSSPESNVFEHNGKVAYASDIMPGVKKLGDVTLTKELAQKAMKGFVADVLVGNWDAAGLSLDNMVVTSSGEIARIDNGGSLLFRAQAGKRKPAELLNQITEWDKLFSSSNPSYAKIAAAAGYSGPEDMKDLVMSEIAKVRKLRDAYGGWEGYVNTVAGGMIDGDKKQIISMLESRTTLLEAKSHELTLPKPPDRTQPIIGHLPAKKLPPTELPPPEGKDTKSYRAIVDKRLPVGSEKYTGVKAFTGSSYGNIRDVERKPEAEARASMGNSSYEQYKRNADQIEKFFKDPATRPTPCTVYRGIRGLDDAVMRKFMENDEFDMGATTSTSRTPSVSYSFGNISASGGGYSTDNRILLVLKQRSAVAIETISSVEHENELLLHRSATFKVTSRHRAEGQKNVLIIEAEEIGDGPFKAR